MRHRLGLVFQDFDAHAVRRLDEGLVQPVLLPGSTGTPAAFHWAMRAWTLSTMKPTWFTTEPWLPPSPFSVPRFKLMYTPGNIMSGFPPGMNNLPPMARKSFLFASRSLEAMCQWPIVTPVSLNGAGCAAAVAAVSTETSNKPENTSLMDASLLNLMDGGDTAQAAISPPSSSRYRPPSRTYPWSKDPSSARSACRSRP